MDDKKVWHLYMLRCSDGTFYTGITPDVKKRLHTHNAGRGAKYTRGRLPVALVYTTVAGTKSEASKMEYVLRHKSRVDKEKLACYTDCDYVAD